MISMGARPALPVKGAEMAWLVVTCGRMYLLLQLPIWFHGETAHDFPEVFAADSVRCATARAVIGESDKVNDNGEPLLSLTDCPLSVSNAEFATKQQADPSF